ncbi:hypothetical protein [Clostridium algidicarnis]|uniref:hypothetical protein n=1 Tax=Clostridium algidicarnis TaxID=37659 RepID=UPI003FD8BCC1
MLKQQLFNKGIILNKELADMVVADIKFNNISFNKKTSLEELLTVAERCDLTLRRCN